MGHTPVDRVALRVRVEAALGGFLRGQHARLALIDPALAQLGAIIEGLVLGGGKRLRPAFAYWGYRGAGGEDSDDIMTAVSTLELVQAGALIHDDVIDASATRRGKPSVHRRWEDHHREAGWAGDPVTFGENAAILAGDLCMAWSDEMFHTAGVDPVALARARIVFDDMRTEVMVGQYLDVLASVTGDMTIERASKIATYKSAKYTVERPLLLGAALADAPPEILAGYSAYGLAIGEAFQLRDDILGVYGDPSETGKPAGDDLREGKRTYLIATAFALAGPAAIETMRRGLGDHGLDDADVREFREVIDGCGALDRTEQRISYLTEVALDALARLNLAGDAGTVLSELAAAAVRRHR